MGDRPTQQPDRPTTDAAEGDDVRGPVLTGLIALAAVAVVIGLVLGLGTLVGAKVSGLSGSDEAAAGPTGGGTLYLPDPVETSGETGPLVTLEPGEEDDLPTAPETSEETTEPAKELTLTIGAVEVSSMASIPLSGVYPGGEGAILRVQRFENGAWSDFPVTVEVRDEMFSTVVQSAISGENKFRVVDTDSTKTSNPVTVTIG